MQKSNPSPANILVKAKPSQPKPSQAKSSQIKPKSSQSQTKSSQHPKSKRAQAQPTRTGSSDTCEEPASGPLIGGGACKGTPWGRKSDETLLRKMSLNAEFHGKESHVLLGFYLPGKPRVQEQVLGRSRSWEFITSPVKAQEVPRPPRKVLGSPRNSNFPGRSLVQS